MSQNKNTTYLYRIENPNIIASPDGITSHEVIVGQWFSPDPSKAVQYLKKSQKAPRSQLVVAEVPTPALGNYHVSKHPIASGMDVEDDNYLLPRDATVMTTTIPLDQLVGDLNPNILPQRLEAIKCINGRLGEMTLLNTEPD